MVHGGWLSFSRQHGRPPFGWVTGANTGTDVKASRLSIEQNVLDVLVCRGLLSQAELDRAVEEATRGGIDIETLLLDRYQVPKAVLGAILSDYYQCPYLPFDERTVIDSDLVRTLSHDYLKKNLWLPIARRGQLLDVLTHDPHDLERGWDVRRSFPGMTIRYSVGLRRDVEQFLGALASQGGGSAIGTLLSELVEDVPPEPAPELSAGPIDENDSLIVRLTSHLITEADRLGASDLHLEPCTGKKDMNIRFRVDGTCFNYTKVPAVYRRALVSRIKIMANLDIAERRKPQDGKIRFKLGNQRTIELRVATLPTAGGNGTHAVGSHGIHAGHLTDHQGAGREAAWHLLVRGSDGLRENHVAARDFEAYQHRRAENLDGGRPH